MSLSDPRLQDKVLGVASLRAMRMRPCQAESCRVVESAQGGWLGALDTPSPNAPSSFQGHPAPAGFHPHWLLANTTPPGPENIDSAAGWSELKDLLETQQPTQALGPHCRQGRLPLSLLEAG